MALRRLANAIRVTLVTLFLGAGVAVATGSDLWAQPLFDDTHLIDIRLGSGQSKNVKDISKGRIMLSDRTQVPLSQWYESRWRDLSLTWLTRIDSKFGILWGVSTGESASKYRIEPSLKLGFIAQTDLTRNSTLTLMASTILGGRLTEEPCTADYGAIGGVQTVNCRLASTFLPPAETLNFLFNEPPNDQVQITLRFRLQF